MVITLNYKVPNRASSVNNFLKNINLKKIIYTEDGGKISVKRYHQLASTHYSRAQRVTMSKVKDITHPKIEEKEMFTHKKVKKKSSKKY